MSKRRNKSGEMSKVKKNDDDLAVKEIEPGAIKLENGINVTQQTGKLVPAEDANVERKDGESLSKKMNRKRAERKIVLIQ